MPTTIEGAQESPAKKSRPNLVLGGASALAVWFGAMTLIAAAVDLPVIIAFGAPKQIIDKVVAENGYPMSAGARFVTARMPSAAAARSLIGNGAFLVWPAVKGGCVDPKALR